MKKVFFIKVTSYRDDGKFVENETGDELTEEEAVEIVQEYWEDMPSDYYSWNLEKVIFKESY